MGGDSNKGKEKGKKRPTGMKDKGGKKRREVEVRTDRKGPGTTIQFRPDANAKGNEWRWVTDQQSQMVGVRCRQVGSRD